MTLLTGVWGWLIMVGAGLGTAVLASQLLSDGKWAELALVLGSGCFLFMIGIVTVSVRTYVMAFSKLFVRIVRAMESQSK